MGSSEFQKELISYLEDENNKLRNKVNHMKENLEKVLTRDSSKNILETVVEEVMNVCTAMTEEVEDLYDSFSATSAALCTVLKRKSQMVQLTKKLSELHAVEQIDPELELIEANNMACFAKKLSDGKNNKRGTAKVSPMIKGHVILTAPRIHLNRVNQDASIRHRIVSESPQLSPVVEISPATPPRNQRHLFFREIQIPLQRLNINSDGQVVNSINSHGQVVNRNTEDSPRTTVIKKPTRVPASKLVLRSSEPPPRNSEALDTTDPVEEENEEVARDEEKENLSSVRDVDNVNDTTVREESSQLCEDENNEEECSPNSSTHSPNSNNGKEKSFSSPEEAVDPLEGPSWLLDGRPNRRRSSTKSSSFNFVNVRRKRNAMFSLSDPEPAENQTSEPKLDPVIEQQEPDESEELEENGKDKNNDNDNDVSMNDSVDTSEMSMTECVPEKSKKIGKDKKNDVSMNVTADTSDMEMTECIPVPRREIINAVNKSLHSVEKVSSSVLESSLEINASVLRTSEQPSLTITERQCIGESSEEEEPDNISSIDTPKSEKSKTEHTLTSPENSRDRKTPEMGTLELVLEKIDARLPVSSDSSPKHVSPHNKIKHSPKSRATEAKSSSESDSHNPSSPERIVEPPQNLCSAPENTGRPKRGAALRCMEQKVWIVNTPEQKKNQNRNRNNSNLNNNNVNNTKSKPKRKQENDNENSPNDKKQRKRLNSVKNKEEESYIDSEGDSSSRDSFSSNSPPKRKPPKTNVQNDETNQTLNQNNRNTISRPTDADSKNKRKGAPTSTIETSMNESNRTNDRTVNGSSILEDEGRKRRKAAPGSLKEPSLNAKLRR